MAKPLEPKNVSAFLASIGAKLRTSGLRLTKPRKSILRILLQDHGPFSCEDIFKKISELKNIDNCDLVTVYRSMAKLEETGVVERCDFGDGKVRYEIRHENHHHHHIVCRVCKTVKIVTDCSVVEGKSVSPLFGFRDVTHRLEFFGVCPSC